MNLYIEIENGQPIGHPFMEENLLQTYGDIPSNFAPFKRVPRTEHNLSFTDYEKDVCAYALSDDGVTWYDKWTIEPLTSDEIVVRIAEIQREKRLARGNLLIIQAELRQSQNNTVNTSNTA